MATTKKHIAVYLDPAVQQALSDFCERRGLKSRKGVVFSAGVNTALAEFFGIAGIEEGNTPIESGNIPNNVSDIPDNVSDIPDNVSDIPNNVSDIPDKTSSIPTKSISNTPIESRSSIPVESLAVEVLPGKFQA